jgi:putative DNA primase/helicase
MNNFFATNIDEQHMAEFKASAIADDIAALNFRTWNPFNDNDLDDVFTLLVEEPAHRNNGTLAGRSQNGLVSFYRLTANYY